MHVGVDPPLEGAFFSCTMQVFPERVYDVGIAEQHAVTFAAGLACEGLAPFVAIYSSFLQRGYDQVVHDVSLQNLPGAAAASSSWQEVLVSGGSLSCTQRCMCGNGNMYCARQL